MTFRYARHTTDLQNITNFYTDVVGLSILGSFENHDGYDGIFLGFPERDWHLEFTLSENKPHHTFDEDDALVFYVYSEMELSVVQKRLDRLGIQAEQPKNPYWSRNGVMISDPDGHKIIFSVQHKKLSSEDKLTRLVRSKDIHTWNELLEFVRQLPYGRNQNREDLSLVISEGKGSCSSKHALLKKIAENNQISGVELILGMYKMNQHNTPKIGTTLTDHGMDYIPEAHCYLKLNDTRFDLTLGNNHFEIPEKDILKEIVIAPEDVTSFKVAYHQTFLKIWMAENNILQDFATLWSVREMCIQKLSE
jgi:catechol 2,3-dioxygenase-like lactoylglutathione lyase family enzyme